jgi:hypothetical protein
MSSTASHTPKAEVSEEDERVEWLSRGQEDTDELQKGSFRRQQGRRLIAGASEAPSCGGRGTS